MNPILIIGYGNPLRSDDGVGRKAAEALQDLWPADKVRIESAHQLTPETAEAVAQAETVIFIDAQAGSPPGAVHCAQVVPEMAGDVSMTHHLTPPGLLAAAASLFGRAPEALLVSMNGGAFDHGEQLSPPVASAFPTLVARVKGLVESRIGTTRHA